MICPRDFDDSLLVMLKRCLQEIANYFVTFAGISFLIINVDVILVSAVAGTMHALSS